jgi:MoxR-like ATPase
MTHDFRVRLDRVRDAVGSVLVGQRAAVDEVLATILAGGHVLLEGPPGVAKTLLARSLAQVLGLQFRRVQFTPDLMPSDVVGTRLFDFQQSSFRMHLGPVFTNVLLADEINRTPPKTQAALLEAMQEHQVTIDGETHPLPRPFLVIATQNPLEFEGTYPLPEAQLDRFMVKVEMAYPTAEEELDVYRRFLDGRLGDAAEEPPLGAVTDAAGIESLRAAARGVHVEASVLQYLRDLVRATRATRTVALGASPRAGLALLALARSIAAMEGRAFVLPDDIKRMALPALRHRLLLTPDAELETVDVAEVVLRILATVEVPK